VVLIIHTDFRLKKLLNNAVIIFGIASIVVAAIAYIIKSRGIVSIAIYLWGVTSILVGIDTILSKRIIMPSAYSRRLKETYLGIAAVSHGVIFLILGALFFIQII